MLYCTYSLILSLFNVTNDDDWCSWIISEIYLKSQLKYTCNSSTLARSNIFKCIFIWTLALIPHNKCALSTKLVVPVPPWSICLVCCDDKHSGLCHNATHNRATFLFVCLWCDTQMANRICNIPEICPKSSITLIINILLIKKKCNCLSLNERNLMKNLDSKSWTVFPIIHHSMNKSCKYNLIVYSIRLCALLL